MISTARECIRLAQATARAVVEGEVKAGEVERPASLSPIELLSGAEVFEILMVRPNLYRVTSPFEIVTPFLESSNDGKHLSVMDLVIVLYRIQSLGEKGNRMPFSIFRR